MTVIWNMSLTKGQQTVMDVGFRGSTAGCSPSLQPELGETVWGGGEEMAEDDAARAAALRARFKLGAGAVAPVSREREEESRAERLYRLSQRFRLGYSREECEALARIEGDGEAEDE